MVFLLFWEDVFVSFDVVMCACRNPVPAQQHIPQILPGTMLDPPRITEADVQPSQGLWHEDQGCRGGGRGGGRGGYGGRGGGRGALADAAHRMLNHSVHSMGLVSPGGYDPRSSQGAYQQPPRNYDDQQASAIKQMCCNSSVSTIASVQ